MAAPSPFKAKAVLTRETEGQKSKCLAKRRGVCVCVCQGLGGGSGDRRPLMHSPTADRPWKPVRVGFAKWLCSLSKENLQEIKSSPSPGKTFPPPFSRQSSMA